MNDQNTLLTQEKSIPLCIILSLVTFAIYYIVWMYGICKKIKLMAGEEPSCGGELACILLVPFYSLYWLYTRSKKLAQAGTNCGIQLEDKSVINLLLAIFGFGIVSVALIQSDLNKAARAFAGVAA